MTDVTLDEGALRFHFVGVDFAAKYDEWKHYRNSIMANCSGAKAVDFVVCKGDEVWLIEVKDYRLHSRTKPGHLWDEISEKVRDTLMGLASAGFLAHDEDEQKVAKTAFKKKKLRVMLHLEQASSGSRLHSTPLNPANVKLKLEQKLRFADFHPQVVDRSKFPGRLGTVQHI